MANIDANPLSPKCHSSTSECVNSHDEIKFSCQTTGQASPIDVHLGKINYESKTCVKRPLKIDKI